MVLVIPHNNAKSFTNSVKNGQPHGHQKSASMPARNQDNKNQKFNFEYDHSYFWNQGIFNSDIEPELYEIGSINLSESGNNQYNYFKVLQ